MHLVETEEKIIKVPKDCDPSVHVLNVCLMNYHKVPLDLVSSSSSLPDASFLDYTELIFLEYCFYHVTLPP